MISWYLNRIKTFSLLEYPYRAKQVVQKKFEELFVQKKVPAAKTCIVEKTLLHPFGLDGQLPDASIDIFGKSFDFSDPQKIEWHKDIFSNQSFPRIFSKNISILKNPSLSAKVVWEINRLQFLQKIALHYNSTNDPNSLQLFVSIMKSWIIANPFMIGINWYSNIEINLRLINWFVCWELLDADSLIIEDDTFKEFSEKFWIPSIYHHCIYSFRNPSKHSSANNHLISEYAGLFVASSKWKFREWKKWNNYAAVGLEKEIAKQHSENGVNKEEAAEYIQFITDFFLISFIVAERTGKLFSSTYSSYLHNIFKYISVLLDCNGNFPKYGDEDDGRCF